MEKKFNMFPMKMFHIIKKEINKLRLSPKGYLTQCLQKQKIDSDDECDITFLKGIYGETIIRKDPIHISKGTLLILSFLPLPYVIKMEVVLACLFKDRGWTVKILTNSAAEYMVRAYHEETQNIEVQLIENFIIFKNIKDINKTIKSLIQTPSLNVAIIKELKWNGVPVGMHALATYLSSMPEGRFEKSKRSLSQLQRILRRSMLYVDASNNFLNNEKPELVIGMEKGFVGTCEIFYSALIQEISYVQWVGCHEPNSIMFKKYTWKSQRDHPFSICENDWAWIKELSWSDSYRERVMQKFESGYKQGDWFKYKSLTSGQTFSGADELKHSLNLDLTKKTAVIYSHILSDANLFYGEDIFPNGYEEWLIETVRCAGKNLAVNWVLKLHPANKVRNFRIGYLGEYGEIQALRNAFGKVPEFLRVVYPENKISPLSFFHISDYGVTVRGTIGIELPCFGIPVLTAGTGRYSGKGFTYDSSTKAEFLCLIEKIHEIKPLTEIQIKLAIMYAFFVFNVRPAKYDEIFTDIYEHDQTHRRYRDFAFKLSSFADIGAHPQMQAILKFLEDNIEDFISELQIPIS